MAVHKPTSYINPWDTSIPVNILPKGSGGTITASNVTTQMPTHAIQGKMLTASIVISDFEYTQNKLDPMDIKQKLMAQLVEKMFEDKNIEFTKMQDVSTWDHKFHARIYVVPDTQVRILRENKVATSQAW